MTRKKLSIVFTSAECAPFAKVGGMADVLGSLPQELAKLNCAVTVILPKYHLIDENIHRMTPFGEISFEFHRKHMKLKLYQTRLPKNPVRYLFIEHPYFNNNFVYESRTAVQARQNHRPHRITDIHRFSLFSRAVIEAINQLKLPCDIINCSDWHTALVPAYVDERAVTTSYPFTKTVFTIHNLGNQGVTPRSMLKQLDLMPTTTPYLMEDYDDLDGESINLMKLGILSADVITTVSATYAREILTAEYGATLEQFLRRRKKDITGIVNGIDINFFNPAKDRSIFTRYTTKTWKRGKAANKKQLQHELGLPERSVPLYGMVSRLAEQKGLDILIPVLKKLLHRDVQVAILGTGNPDYEKQLRKLRGQHPGKLSASLTFDVVRAQKIYAGSDFFLMPSRFEPCGLGQMIAMRYGSVPIVRATGGLKDTVQHNKTGIVFTPYTEAALMRAVEQSLKLYANQKKWYTVVASAMRQDFSWTASARHYRKLYEKLIA